MNVSTPTTDRGRIHLGATNLPARVDVVVIGLGVTGAGVALDAATRGLSVVALDAHDVAFGTSRWSSKLVHGGLRYLANLQVSVARESAVERGVLMETVAPHLTRTLPTLIPLTREVSRRQALLARTGTGLGDLLRIGAGTSSETLPRSRRISAVETRALAPVVPAAGLRGGILGFDGQLLDDARLVLGIARTAAAYGARVHTRCRVLSATGEGVEVRDERTGTTHRLHARVVVNATGVWAGDLDHEITLRPSRGSHLVLRESSLPGLRAALMVPVPGSSSRFVFALPQVDGLVYVGLTDEPVTGPVPDVPVPAEHEVDFLLASVNRALTRPVGRDDVVGRFAGLRPLLAAEGATADLSRRHAVRVSANGTTTVVGGKLTTYRQMAQDALDTALEHARLRADPCRTREVPLLGAAPRSTLADLAGPARLVQRYGTEAESVVATASATTGLGEDDLLAPVAEGLPTTLAELVFGITHEGAGTTEDLLERRTRLGLVPADAARARPAAERALRLVGHPS